MTAASRKESEDVPVDPAELLPEDSVLSFEEYLEMQRAIGEKTRYRILHVLRNHGEKSPKELTATLGLAGNALHHHLNTLVDVGLVEKRARKEADSRGLYTYYRATAIGEGILEHGLETVMRKEHEYRERYGNDSG